MTVLVTGAGAPGIKGTLHSLRNNPDGRRVRVVGTDISPMVVGRFLCDSFHVIHRPHEGEYLVDLLDICLKEAVDVILPQNTAELSVLAENRDHFLGTTVAVSDEAAMAVANDKQRLMEEARVLGVPVPEFMPVSDFPSLRDAAAALGWPDRPVVVKPPVSNGMRGLRIIDENIDLKREFYNAKPGSGITTMAMLEMTLGEEFPSLLVMEHLPGEEYTVDVLGAGDVVAIPRSRDVIRTGITFAGTLVEDGEMIRHSDRLTRAMGLEFAHGYQFKRDADGTARLIESNPRVQGTMALSTMGGANIIYGAVKFALGEEVPEFDIRWGTRLLRYWGGIACLDDEFRGEL